MKDSKQAIDSVAREISRSQNSSPTAAGPTEKPKVTAEHIDAINQVFSLFRINFGNLYYASFKNQELEKQAKRLWLESLHHLPAHTILLAAKSVIAECEYLPTLKVMLDHCHKAQGQALPDAHSAYVEACQAPSPKAGARWSHPAVYHAGKASDWYFLATNTEATALPVFRRHYQEFCEQVRRGVDLATPELEALPEPQSQSLSKEENKARLQALRDSLDI